MLAARFLRPVCAAIFVAGIAGIIVTSINGNNAGWVLSIGMVTAVAASASAISIIASA